MKLGGNIELEGFDNLEPAQLVVIKKIVGSSAKKTAEEIAKFDNLLITLKENEKVLTKSVIVCFVLADACIQVLRILCALSELPADTPNVRSAPDTI